MQSLLFWQLHGTGEAVLTVATLSCGEKFARKKLAGCVN
jgi:hypothetical protein